MLSCFPARKQDQWRWSLILKLVNFFQGWYISARNNRGGAIVDLPAYEFFFRLEPAVEQFKLSREAMSSENFDIHLNLRKSYDRLAGTPMLISPQFIANNGGGVPAHE